MRGSRFGAARSLPSQLCFSSYAQPALGYVGAMRAMIRSPRMWLGAVTLNYGQ